MKFDLMDIPEYKYKKDILLVNLMLASAYILPMYATFIGYIFGVMKYVWMAGAVILAFAVWFSGRKIQMIGARLMKFKQPEFDPEKEARDYFVPRKSLLSLLFSLAVGTLFFLAATLIHKYYMENFDDKTISQAAGYVYELVAGCVGFVSAYIPAVVWFIPDELMYTNELSVIYLIIPIGMVLIPTIYMPVPVYYILVALIPYVVMLLIRYRRIRNYNHMVKKIKEDAMYDAHNSKHGW